jgi:hypothetical protein
MDNFRTTDATANETELMTESEIEKWSESITRQRDATFDTLVRDGYFRRSSPGALSKSDDDLRVGMPSDLDQHARDRRRFTGPMSRRELNQYGKA